MQVHPEIGMDNIINRLVALAHGERHTRYTGDGYRPVDGPISAKALADHLNGGQALGVYMCIGSARTASHCLVLDFDDHDKRGIALMPTQTVALHLESLGIPHLIFRSGGGHGYHIWLVFKEARPPKWLRNFATAILASVEVDREKFVPVKSGKLAVEKRNAKGKVTHVEHGVEVLPKGDGWQNVAIPCGRESVPMRIVRRGTLAALEQCALDDLTLEFVPVPEHEVEPAEMGEGERDAAFDAFIKAYDVDDYTSWGAAGLALVAAFGADDEWAKERWVAWARGSAKFKSGDEDQWDGLKPKKYSPLSFWRIATRNGYQGPWPGKKKGVSDSKLEAFNAEWALMYVEGKVEFLNTTTGFPSNTESFNILTEPEEDVRNTWRKWDGRRQFNGYTFAPPGYTGDKFNLFRGWPVEPTSGDASLFEKYVVEILCRGDTDLAHWVLTFVADAVQRPWSARPGSGLAIRGPQGSGKSFLGKCVQAALGELALEVTNSQRVGQQFNDLLVGKTVLLCEEAFFTGSPQQANMLKNLITARDWTFEPKNRKSFTTPNIFRVIATTNHSHAVAIDNDDRRWTIIESLPICPHDPDSRAARDWWEPYYSLVENDPGAVLRFLLDYKVDRGLIGVPHHTAAKAEDKESSDPLLQVLIHMVETGTCPDDLRGDGRVASGAIYERVKERGGRWSSQQSLANDLRKRFGAKTAKGCIKIKRVEMRSDSSGIITPVVVKRADYDGLQMPPLAELRSMVSAITRRAHEGPEAWQPFKPDSPEHIESDPNGGDAEVVEQYVIDKGQVVDHEVPF